MSIDEAIQHCEEVEKEQLKLYGICPASESAIYHCSGTKDCRTLKNGRDRGCLKCAAEHRQLAEWLTELKHLRNLIAYATDYDCKINRVEKMLRIAEDAVKQIEE